MRLVVGVVEALEVGHGGGVEVGDRSAGGPRVRVSGEGRLEQAEEAAGERRVLLLADLLLHHLALGGDGGRVEAQATHALGLELDREVEVPGRHGVDVVGRVLVGRGVAAAAHSVDEASVLLGADPGAALEHDVLEHVGRATPVAPLFLRPDPVPDLHGHHRGGVDRDHRDLQAVAEGEPLDRRERCGPGRGDGRRAAARRSRRGGGLGQGGDRAGAQHGQRGGQEGCVAAGGHWAEGEATAADQARHGAGIGDFLTPPACGVLGDLPTTNARARWLTASHVRARVVLETRSFFVS